MLLDKSTISKVIDKLESDMNVLTEKINYYKEERAIAERHLKALMLELYRSDSQDFESTDSSQNDIKSDQIVENTRELVWKILDS